MVCKNCGTENIDQALFCVGCGTPLRQEAPPAQPSAPEGKKQKTAILAGSLAAGAVLLVFVCLLLFRGGGKGYETVAENFVVALFRNDQEMLEDITEPRFYAYLRMVNAKSGADACRAEAISAETCDEERIGELRQLYQLLGGDCELENVCTVEVEYTIIFNGYQSTDVADVTLSEIDGCWYVVDIE